MSSLIVLVIVILLGCGLYAASRPRPLFAVRIEEGKPLAVRGTITRGFLQDVADTCARHDVRRGEVSGVADGRRIHLRFSGPIPPACRQQLRNLWNISGWPAGPPTSRRLP
jgi:hypothetical protein